MPGRSKPHPIAVRIGKRVRALRQEKGLTLQELADQSGIPASHLSRIERGLSVITLRTINKIADGLAVEAFFVLTFPEEDDYQRLVDLTRKLSPEELAALQRKLARFSKRGARRRRARDGT